jgi:hypothetical protein
MYFSLYHTFNQQSCTISIKWTSLQKNHIWNVWYLIWSYTHMTINNHKCGKTEFFFFLLFLWIVWDELIYSTCLENDCETKYFDCLSKCSRFWYILCPVTLKCNNWGHFTNWNSIYVVPNYLSFQWWILGSVW